MFELGRTFAPIFGTRSSHESAPNSHDQRHADVEEPVRAQAEPEWIINIEI